MRVWDGEGCEVVTFAFAELLAFDRFAEFFAAFGRLFREAAWAEFASTIPKRSDRVEAFAGVSVECIHGNKPIFFCIAFSYSQS